MADKTKAIYPRLKQAWTQTSSGSNVCSYSNDIGGNIPILTLIHGYPQSSYIWRYVVPDLVDKVSLFVPEIPGYGISTACKTHSKKAVGSALLEALELVFKIPQGSKRKVILGGHDRGARICHRIAVDKTDFPNLEIVSLVVLDIVPTKVQWEAFANPSSATNYWHWSFLPNVEIATEMIQAFGGDKWCRYQMSRIQGPNQECRKKLAAGGALDLYAELFKKRETIVGACEDYASGAQPEVNEQSEDMQHGRRVEVPTLALWSAALIGSKLDVGKIWREWVTDGVEMKGVPIGNGAGHYLPEENSKEVVAALADWVKQFA